MRTKYITRSYEINDVILEAYEYYVHLIGRDNVDGTTTHSGIYDVIEDSIYYNNSEYVIVRNDYKPEDQSTSIPQYLDSISYKINKLGRQ